MNLSRFLETVVHALDDAGVAAMVTGSLAAAFYATPRATQDVDVVIATDSVGVDRLVDSFLHLGFYVDRPAAQSACRHRSQFNAIHPDTGWKVDLICRKDRAFSLEEFRRRRRVILLGVGVPIASLEDLILSKLEWSRLGDSELQRRDVIHLLRQGRSDVDREYMKRWASELGLTDDWREVQERSGMDDLPG